MEEKTWDFFEYSGREFSENGACIELEDSKHIENKKNTVLLHFISLTPCHQFGIKPTVCLELGYGYDEDC